MSSVLEPSVRAWVESTLFSMDQILDSANASDVCEDILKHNTSRLDELGRRMASLRNKVGSGPLGMELPKNDDVFSDSVGSENALSLSLSNQRADSKVMSVSNRRPARRSILSGDCDEAYAWFELRQQSGLPTIHRKRKRSIGSFLITALRALRYFVSIARLYAVVGTSFVISFLDWSPSLISLPELICEVFLLVGVFLPSSLSSLHPSHDEIRLSGLVVTAHVPSILSCIDIVSAIPWHAMWLASGYGTFLKLSLIRLLHFFSLTYAIAVSGGTGIHVSNFSIHPHILRVVGLFSVYFLFIHLFACGYRLVAGSSDQTLWGSNSLGTGDPMEAYLGCLYWSVGALSFGSVSPGPSSATELGYSFVTVFVGVFLTSGIVGIIASLMGRIDERSSRHRAKLDSIETFLRKHRIRSDLGTDIRKYYTYWNSSYRATIDQGLLTELSPSLRLKLDLCLYSKFIKQCALFQNCPARCVVDLIDVISRNRMIFLPLERIFKQGDLGEIMYFVVRGEILLYTLIDGFLFHRNDLEAIVQMEVGEEDDYARVIARLSSGESFGEMALLYDRPRAASSIATIWTELLGLPRGDFHIALERYPDLAQRMWERARLVVASGALTDHRSSSVPESEGSV